MKILERLKDRWAHRGRKDADAAERPAAEKQPLNDPSEVNTTVEIPVYAPHQGLIPKEYMLSARLVDLEANFRDYCFAFFESGCVDAYNGSFADTLIDSICDEDIRLMHVQRADHMRTIETLLDKMHRGDYIKLIGKRESFRREKEENLRKLNDYRHILFAGTSLADEE
ncbi:MAG: hypothetical protein IKR61_04565 [Lachnospiraceae bacterium]|nr:hypothetical protein [Lachnospiraceae bacterium]